MTKEDFSKLVNKAMANNDLASMRPVVEKELLHYEIFHALDQAGLLRSLVFQGGTSLRLCRGSDRFSEDLVFAGGRDFSAQSMKKISGCVESRIGARFGLNVKVTEPKPPKEGAQVTVAKWMISIETTAGNPSIPRQKIKLEIANIPAYTSEAVPLRANYESVAAGSTVLVNTESIDEVLADKTVALPTSISKKQDGKLIHTPTRVRYRDIWDIAWLISRGAKLDARMVNDKILDYGIENYEALLDFAAKQMSILVAGDSFKAQMRRFIAKQAYEKRFGTGYEAYFVSSVNDQFRDMKTQLT